MHSKLLKERMSRKNVPKGSKIITSTWACKKKANGTYRARLNGRGYEQVDGEHYDSSDIAAPVTNEMTVRSMLTIALMDGWLKVHSCSETLRTMSQSIWRFHKDSNSGTVQTKCGCYYKPYTVRSKPLWHSGV